MIIKNGFTLIEMIVTLAIIALLIVVALPSYQHYALQTRRSDAYTALTLAAATQERTFAIHHQYSADINQLSSSKSSNGFYDIDVELLTEGYLLTATATPDGPQAKDLNCLTITLDFLGVQSPQDCW